MWQAHVTRFLCCAWLRFFLSSAVLLRRKVGERTTHETVGLSYMSSSATLFLTTCVREGRHNNPIKTNVSCFGHCVISWQEELYQIKNLTYCMSKKILEMIFCVIHGEDKFCYGQAKEVVGLSAASSPAQKGQCKLQSPWHISSLVASHSASVWKQQLIFSSSDIMEGRCACFVAAAAGSGAPDLGRAPYDGPQGRAWVFSCAQGLRLLRTA